jgi:DNA-binding response OmpR family regulator
LWMMATPTISASEKKQILLVDDDISFLTSLAEGLSDEPRFVISSATNGKEAIELIDVKSFDLVITDIKMPLMGGFELVAYLGRHHPEVPVIVMTAFGTSEIEVNLRLLGVSQYVEKPIDFDLFLKKVREVLDDAAPPAAQDLQPTSSSELLAILKQGEAQNVHGEVIAIQDDKSARFFFYQGKIAWINATTLKKTLLNHLVDNSNLNIEELKAVFNESKKSGGNFGETIVEWGLLEEEAFRGLLIDHIAEAFSEVLMWQELHVIFVPDKRRYQGRFLFGVDEVLTLAKEKLNDMSRSKRSKHRAGKRGGNPKRNIRRENPAGQNSPAPEPKGEIDMSIQTALESMKAVDGFMGAAAFTAAGELLAEAVGSAGNLAELGALANDVLLKSQKTTDIMGVGRGNMIHIVAPKANILVRCLNENTDFAANEPGRAHVHMMLIIEPEGNIALAKMRLEKAIQEAAPELR